MAESRLSLVITEAINIKRSNVSRKLFHQWRAAEIFAAVFSFFGIISAGADYEAGFSPNRTHDNCAENVYHVYRFLTFMLTFVSMVFLIARHRLKVQWRNKRPIENLSRSIQRASSRSFFSKRLIIELIILSIFPYPFFTGSFTYMQSSINEKNEYRSFTIPLCYNYSEILFIVMFFRFFFIIRALFNFTPYQDDHAKYCCSKYKTRSNVRFSMRCMMRTHPFLIICGGSIFSFILFGIFIRVFERPYSDISGLNYESIENSIWNTAITMSTVGYGDLYPSTLLGRLVGVACAMWGGFVFSMIVYTFQVIFQLDSQQKRAFSSIKQTRAAARVVIAGLLYQVMKKRFGRESVQASKQYRHLITRLKMFADTLKRLKQVDTYIEDNYIANRFVGMFKQAKLLENNLNELFFSGK